MYTLIAHDGEVVYGIKEYVIEFVEDLNLLPKCPMGSTALMISTGDVYMKNSSGEWKLLAGGNSSEENGSKENIVIDDTVTENGTNAVSGAAVYAYVNEATQNFATSEDIDAAITKYDTETMKVIGTDDNQ